MNAAADGRIANVTGAVLLGGASSRMGRNKATLALGEVALATQAARLLGNLFEDVLLVGGDPSVNILDLMNVVAVFKAGVRV